MMINTSFLWCSERLTGRTKTLIQMPTAPPFRLCNVFPMVPKSFVFVLVLKPSVNSKRSFYFSFGLLPCKAKFQRITQKCDRIRDVLKMVSKYKHDYTEEVKVKHFSLFMDLPILSLPSRKPERAGYNGLIMSFLLLETHLCLACLFVSKIIPYDIILRLSGNKAFIFFLQSRKI